MALEIDRAVADAMLAQLAPLHGTPAWPAGPPPAGTLRGVDFYRASDFLLVLSAAATRFRRVFHFVPSLLAPSTYNEHLFRRKFFAPLPIPTPADRLVARDWARARAPEVELPGLAWQGPDAAALFAAELPAGRYFLKTTHGAKASIDLRLPGDLVARRAEIAAKTADWLGRSWGLNTGEWHYNTYRPQLILERFIDLEGDRVPTDWKLHVFHGRARAITLDIDRFEGRRRAFYGRDWRPIDLRTATGTLAEAQPRPANLAALLESAERLAGGLDFVRVDLYTDQRERIVFGELTLTPTDANIPFRSMASDHWLGRWFDPARAGE